MPIELKILLRELLLPPASLVALGALGLLLGRRRPRLGAALLAGSWLALWLLSTPRIAVALYHASERYPALGIRAPLDADAIVVLGGGGSRADSAEWGGTTLLEGGWDRAAYAAMLARRSGLPVLVSSHGRDADALRDALRAQFGVEARWVDRDAGDTFENAAGAGRILLPARLSRIVLVTHSNHMARALDEFEHAGFRCVPAPVLTDPTVPDDARGWMPNAGALRYSALGLYELIGRPASALLRRLRS